MYVPVSVRKSTLFTELVALATETFVFPLKRDPRGLLMNMEHSPGNGLIMIRLS